MTNFTLRAKTKTGDFFTFSLHDIPLYLSNEFCILANINNSPILLGNTIHIGDSESNFYVGDIVEKDNEHYVVCYERGFYGINENYIRCYLDDLKDCPIVGNYFTDGFAVPIQYRKHIRFKYKDIIFTIHDIIGKMDNNLLIRLLKDPIDPKECQYDVGIHYKGKRLYLGDKIDDGAICMKQGRIYLKTNEQYIDLDGKDKHDNN